jgi:hypothetical protein
MWVVDGFLKYGHHHPDLHNLLGRSCLLEINHTMFGRNFRLWDKICTNPDKAQYLYNIGVEDTLAKHSTLEIDQYIRRAPPILFTDSQYMVKYANEAWMNLYPVEIMNQCLTCIFEEMQGVTGKETIYATSLTPPSGKQIEITYRGTIMGSLFCFKILTFS